VSTCTPSAELSQFHATFFAESREGLEVMEAGLLDMEAGVPVGERIDAVFRAAHSIKGSAATFGFEKISALTHVMETVLDELRAGTRALEAHTSDTLLDSLDVLRERQRLAASDAISPVNPDVASPDNPETAATQRWLQLALLALANLPAYDAPVFLQLESFEHVQASVFQVTRTPGKPVVYLGCLFLVLGIFAMFYIHDRRIWVWIRPDDARPAQSRVLTAMTSQRRTLDFEHAFARLKTDIQRLCDPSDNLRG